MAQSYGSTILLLPLQSKAAPQTHEDPQGVLERNSGKAGGGVCVCCIQNSLCRLFNLQPAVNTLPELEILREVRMG